MAKRNQKTPEDVLNAWREGVEQFAHATGMEIVFIRPSLNAFAFREPLSSDLQFSCPHENREKVMQIWDELNAGSGSLV